MERSELKAQSDSCDSFINYIGEFYSDTCPTDGNIKFLPYESVSSIYNEYCSHVVTKDLIPASQSTFRACFNKVEDKYRLVTAKGSFQTCDICNNANAMLRFQDNQNRYQNVKEQRNIILSYKRTHLDQQASERDHQMKIEKNVLLEINMVNHNKLIY